MNGHFLPGHTSHRYTCLSVVVRWFYELRKQDGTESSGDSCTWLYFSTVSDINAMCFFPFCHSTVICPKKSKIILVSQDQDEKLIATYC